jgi:RNA polymerase sigma-70 factor (ECF subfamily)
MNIKQFEIEILPLKDKVARLAFYLLSDREEAEDASQEVFLKLWNMRDDLSAVENMQAFVLRVARNLCLDKIRAQSRKVKREDSNASEVEEKTDNPYEKTEIRDTLSVVKHIIATLPETQRTVIMLRDIEELDFDEIAAVTGLNENAIKVNLSRARKKIRMLFTKKK